MLDLACGTGAVTQLLIEGLEKNGDRAEVIAVDSSERRWRRPGDSLVRRQIRSRARLSHSGAGPHTDVIVFCNAIHLLPEKDKMIEQAREVLNKDGVLAFNTSFYEGCYTPGTEKFYKLWMLRSLQMLKREHPELSWTSPARKP